MHHSDMVDQDTLLHEALLALLTLMAIRQLVELQVIAEPDPHYLLSATKSVARTIVSGFKVLLHLLAIP